MVGSRDLDSDFGVVVCKKKEQGFRGESIVFIPSPLAFSPMKTKKGNGHRKRNLFFFVNFWICRLQQLMQLVTFLPVDHWCEIAGPNFTVKENFDI